MTYRQSVETNIQEIDKKKKRKRKIIWYNPPYSMNVKSNIGKTFFKLVKKYFPKKNKLHKIFNKNTLKISYSCMRNISSIISSHNKRVLNPPVTNYGCNCRYKINCPLQNECLTPQIVYKAIVSNDQNNEVRQYIGLTSNTFKERYNGHNTSFRLEKYRKEQNYQNTFGS